MITQAAFGGVQSMRFCEVCGRELSNPVSVKFGIGPICRGKHRNGGDMDRKHSTFDAGKRFAYQGYGDCDCHCRLQVNGNVVVATESEDNEGTSITNMAEELARGVCKVYGIPMDRLVWIEHYAHDHIGSSLPECFDLVQFELSREPRLTHPDGLLHFRHPKWRHITQEQAERMLGGEPPEIVLMSEPRGQTEAEQ